jgi:cellulose synthase/poly-beta-1,6-N-acetylglucosamine synthase-like glycosyltransferase
MTFILTIIYVSIYVGLIATTFYALSYMSGKNKEKQLFKDSELPSVSVLIPAFNEEKSIKRTIESILASDYPKNKLEVIVIDDGSKDKTLEIAKKFQSKTVKVFTKENGGKGTALNFGIEKSKGEIIFSMDADTFVESNCVKEMCRYFKNPKVMSVTPSMLIHKPKGILQRIQQSEYLFGLFLRKSFSSINAVHITPGAFSAYRKTFFDKHGGYDNDNITEDLEMSMRIQYNGYIIENSPTSPVYTIAPNKFKTLMIQRRRWYVGLMRNMWKYKGILSPKYGDLGLFVIPIAWISIFLSVFTVNYMAIKTLLNIKKELLFMQSVNFNFINGFELNWFIFERFLYNFFTNEIIIFLLFFMVILWIYLKFATKNVGKPEGLFASIPLYFIFFSILFGFWWTVSILYVVFNRKVTWR